MSDPSISLIKQIGLSFNEHRKRLSIGVNNFPADLCFMNVRDVVQCIKNGIVDLGITGYDVVMESNGNFPMIKLNFGHTNLVVAVPIDSQLKLRSLEGKKIATVFPKITKAFFKGHGINVEIIRVFGAVEGALAIKRAEAIVDLTSTGDTLRANNLRPIGTLIESEAILIMSPKIKKNKMALCTELINRIESILLAQQYLSIFFNISRKRLDDVKKIVPGLNSPTINKLTANGMVAVHSIIKKQEKWEVIKMLKNINAMGILTMPIETLTTH
ncbi:ATP phosphoribosyltransferase [Candidatus Azambacteria bacterium]|nr:ATP phosphoribosyltransferase [Candidatus Azambacteria bacterium]